MQQINNLLQEIHDWLVAQAQIHTPLGIQIKVTNPPPTEVQKGAISIAFIKSDVEASVQLLDTGECDVMVLNMVSGKSLLNVTYEFLSKKEVILSLAAILNLLADPKQYKNQNTYEKIWLATLPR